MKALSRRLGIFAKTFKRESASEVAAEVKRAGYAVAHWNFAAIGLPTLAGGVPESAFFDVRNAFDAAGLSIPSVSATFNTIGVDGERRVAETRMAAALIRRARLLGADVVTLCTGTRDPHDMWRAHPDNGSGSAWRDLRATLDVLLDAASDGDVVLGIEPESGNVVCDAGAAARLLGELGADAPIGIVFDPANLLAAETIGSRAAEAVGSLTAGTVGSRAAEAVGSPTAEGVGSRGAEAVGSLAAHAMDDRQERVLAEAVGELGARIVSVQAKGFGVMDYHLVFRLLAQVPPVPLIVQDVAEGDAIRVRRDLLRWYDETEGAR